MGRLTWLLSWLWVVTAVGPFLAPPARGAAERWVTVADSTPGPSRIERLGDEDEAEYRLVRDGLEVWRRSFDFVPEFVEVSPGGAAALAGYRREQDEPGTLPRHYVLFVMLGPEGELLQDQRTKQVLGIHVKTPFLRMKKRFQTA